MWAASPSSPSKAEGGCGGVGIWYKHRRSLPGTGPLGRGGRPEDGVNVSSLEGRLFQVLTSPLTALPWGPSSLDHQGALRGAEPLWIPQLATRGLLCWSTRTRAPPGASSHLPLAEGLPPDTPPRLLLSAVLWPVCNGVAPVARPVGDWRAAGGGRMHLGCPRRLWWARPSTRLLAHKHLPLPSEGTKDWVLTAG